MTLGGYLASPIAWLRRDSAGALFIVPGLAMIAAVPATALGLFAHIALVLIYLRDLPRR